jgi:hypothetical protein
MTCRGRSKSTRRASSGRSAKVMEVPKSGLWRHSGISKIDEPIQFQSVLTKFEGLAPDWRGVAVH